MQNQNKSESIAKLALALSKFQGEVTDAHKDKSAYNYKYADLAGVLEIARPLCLKYELAVTQLCSTNEGGVGVTTVLMHSSGEWIESTFTMPLISVKGSNAAQAAGSVITYARRYALAAILGITQTDNDAVATEQNWHEILKQYCMDNKISADQAKEWATKYGVERLGQLNEIQIKTILGVK